MSTKKVYVHYEGGDTAFTESMPLNDTTLVSDLLSMFVQKSWDIIEIPVLFASLKTEDGERLEPTDVVLSLVDNKADLFLVIDKKKAANAPATATATATASKGN
jgi:hypothetical protein